MKREGVQCKDKRVEIELREVFDYVVSEEGPTEPAKKRGDE